MLPPRRWGISAIKSLPFYRPILLLFRVQLFCPKYKKKYICIPQRPINKDNYGLVAQSAKGGRAEYKPDAVGAHLKHMKYYVYVLRSINFERHYVGFTRTPHKRLRQHNAGKTRSTKPYLPWEILFFEEFASKEEALKREKFLKTGKGREYIKSASWRN